MGRNNRDFHGSTGFKQLSLNSLVGQRLNILPKAPPHQPIRGAVDQNNLPTLYHGSPSLIKSGSPLNLGGPHSKTDIHSTSSPGIAAAYAAGRDNTRGDNTGQHSFWSILHKVDPVQGSTVTKDITKHGKDIHAYVSKQFKVDKPIGLVDNETHGVTPLGKENIPGLSVAGEKIPQPKRNFVFQMQLPEPPGSSTGI